MKIIFIPTYLRSMSNLVQKETSLQLTYRVRYKYANRPVVCPTFCKWTQVEVAKPKNLACEKVAPLDCT